MVCPLCSSSKGLERFDGICQDCVHLQINRLTQKKTSLLSEVSKLQEQINSLVQRLETTQSRARPIHHCICGASSAFYNVIHDHIERASCTDCESLKTFCTHRDIQHRLLTAEDRGEIIQQSVERERKSQARILRKQEFADLDNGW